jgi:hypothetical protein
MRNSQLPSTSTPLSVNLYEQFMFRLLEIHGHSCPMDSADFMRVGKDAGLCPGGRDGCQNHIDGVVHLWCRILCAISSGIKKRLHASIQGILDAPATRFC